MTKKFPLLLNGKRLMLAAMAMPAFAADTGLPVVSLCIADVAAPVRAEVARRPEERQRGLMQREHLAADAGMLFRFDPPATADEGFYMYRTLIALDIAFLDEDGRIVDIRTMVPCDSHDAFRCPVYRSSHGYHAALEVNAGFFDQHDVRVGDRVRRATRGACASGLR